LERWPFGASPPKEEKLYGWVLAGLGNPVVKGLFGFRR
jgi:hypothetical protein